MNRRPLLVPLALVAMFAPATSCRCSDGQEGQDGRAVSTDRRAETLSVQSFKLKNGLQVELIAGPCGDSVALVGLVEVGVDHDPPGRSGMAHLAERLWSSVPAGRAKRTIAAGDDYTMYSVLVPKDRPADELDEVGAWMSRKPTEADLDRARAQVLQELKKLQGADAELTAMSYAEEAVQPTRGNGRRRGIAAEVEAITLAELQAFWQAHFKPGNARIVVVGSFDPKKLRARLEKALASLPTGKRPVAREAIEATVKGTVVIGDAPKAVALAVSAPALSSPLYPPFLVLATRLMNEPSPGRSWKVSYHPITRPELLFITGAVGKAEQPEPAAARIRTEVATITAKPLTPGDIKNAKERFRLVLEPQLLDPAVCQKDPRAFAIARSRRPQLKGAPLIKALDKISQKQFEEASKLFDPKRIAAVIAGGTIR